MIFKPHPESFFFLKSESFNMNEIWEFLKYYFSILPIGICAFWSEEIQTIIAFTLGRYYLGVHVILQNIALVSFMVAIGSAISASMSIGIYIGRREFHKIRLVLYATLAFANCLIVFVVLIIVI